MAKNKHKRDGDKQKDFDNKQRWNEKKQKNFGFKQKQNKKQPDLFFELKRKFVLNSLFSSTLALGLAFTSIYLLVANYISNRPMDFSFSISQRPFGMIGEQLESDNVGRSVNDFLRAKMREEREASLDALVKTLIITGVGLEIMIVFVAILQAEKSVQPVREAYENQKAFIANASHEIKTPLAVIQANLEAADIQGNHWIDNVQKKVEDITEMNNQLLALTRSEMIESAKKTEVDLGRLTKKTADFYVPKAEEKGLAIRVIEPEKKVKKTIDRAGLEQVLNILIDNAVKYGEMKVEILVGEAGIRVRNDGAKIAKDQIAHVFDRFYQTDKTVEGVGLGLAIAKSVAERNGWKIEVKSGEMVEFFVKF